MMDTLPPTERMRMRPVWLRHMRRHWGFNLDPPSEEEIRDAISVLRDSPAWNRSSSRLLWGVTGSDSPLHEMTAALVLEAERIHAEASAND